MDKVQKALGDYLELERNSFARFYFVGDENLLEIIGNSKTPQKIQRHLTKMFAGVNSLEIKNIDQETIEIVGMMILAYVL